MKSHIIASKALVTLFLILGAVSAHASTVYETDPPTSTVTNTATSSASFSTPTPQTNTLRYVFRYRIPVGTTFDRIQMSVPIGFSSMPGNEIIAKYSGGTFENCTGTDNSCFQGSSTESVVQSFSASESSPTDGTIQWVLSATGTIANSNQYLTIVLDPNSPFPKTYSHNDVAEGVGYSSNGFNYQNVNRAPVIRLCNGVCDNNTFDTSSIGGEPPSQFFITITDPDYGATATSTSVPVSALFYYDGTLGTTTRAEISVYDAVSGALEDTIFQIVPAGYDAVFQLQNTFTLATGSKNIIARYVIAATNQNLIQPAELFFNVIDNTYLAATGLETPLSSPFDLTQIDCDTFDVGCQFQKALVFVFVPRQGTLDKYSDLWQELQYLKPFGYVTEIFRQLETVDQTASGDYVLPSLPFVDDIFTPMRSGISVLLWGIFAMVFYRRIKNIDL